MPRAILVAAPLSVSYGQHPENRRETAHHAPRRTMHAARARYVGAYDDSDRQRTLLPCASGCFLYVDI